MVNPRRVIFASLNSCSEVDAFIPLDQAFDPVLMQTVFFRQHRSNLV